MCLRFFVSSECSIFECLWPCCRIEVCLSATNMMPTKRLFQLSTRDGLPDPRRRILDRARGLFFRGHRHLFVFQRHARVADVQMAPTRQLGSLSNRRALFRIRTRMAAHVRRLLFLLYSCIQSRTKGLVLYHRVQAIASNNARIVAIVF